MENDSVASGWDLLIKRLPSMRSIERAADGDLRTDSKPIRITSFGAPDS